MPADTVPGGWGRRTVGLRPVWAIFWDPPPSHLNNNNKQRQQQKPVGCSHQFGRQFVVKAGLSLRFIQSADGFQKGPCSRLVAPEMFRTWTWTKSYRFCCFQSAKCFVTFCFIDNMLCLLLAPSAVCLNLPIPLSSSSPSSSPSVPFSPSSPSSSPSLLLSCPCLMP